MLKKIIFILIILLGLSVFIFPQIAEEAAEFKVVFLDVGQGDASLIKLPKRHIILIDGGPDNLVLKRLGENLPFYQREIDYLVISHWHDDHFIGLLELIKRYRIKNLVYMAGAERSELANYLLDQAKIFKINIMEIENAVTVNYNKDCHLIFFNPLVLGVKNNGNNSLLTKLDCFEKTFLFSGDNELAVEKALIASNFDLKAQVFKASHHGSKTSNSQEFLEKVKPNLVIISAGEDNRFNHPALEVLQRMVDLGIKIKRTDQDSNVIIRVN